MDTSESSNPSVGHEVSLENGEPLAILADELSKPIRSIRNAVTIIESAGMLPGAMDRAHRLIIRDIGQLSVLVGDLSDVAALSRGALRIQRKWIDVVPEVLAAVAAYSELLTEAGHSVSVAVAQRPVYAYVDGPRLRQVVTNLLDDACQHAPPFACIDLSFGAGGGDLELRVAGQAITDGRSPQISDVFACPRTSFDLAVRRIGLGLSLVREIAATHGGTVEFRRTDLGARCTFIVRLPVCARRSPVKPAESRSGFDPA